MRARIMLTEPVGLLDYRIPEELAGDIRPGVPVKVPLGQRRTRAYVAALTDSPVADGITLRDIIGIDQERPVLPEGLVELILFAADYYAALPGEVLAAALPAVARSGSQRYQVSDAGRDALGTKLKDKDRILLELATRFPKGFTVAAPERELKWTRQAANARIKRLVKLSWLTQAYSRHDPRGVIAYEKVSHDASALGPRQRGARELFDLIPDCGAIVAAKLARQDKSAYPRLKILEKAGLVRRVTLTQRIRPDLETPDRDIRPEPTADQARTITTITAALGKGFSTFLLQGVTGSGKTEVYMRIVEHALSLGGTGLILVPEIALTPQLGARFRGRFGDKVATFHSALTVAERRDEWERVAKGEAVIGLGARSAIFLPLRNLGVVIVDEEYESSFKQEDSPRYNARDLAVVRGQRENAVVVLGSATPSLETYQNAELGRYQLLLMPNRVHTRPMPEVFPVSLVNAERVGEGLFTLRLAREIERVLAADEQAILFLNRRGFAPYVYCRDCGHAFRCPDCDVSLTLHQRREVLLCHYCAFEEPAPDICPKCLSHKLESFGLGTERIDKEIHELFGDVATARLDRDTVRKRADLDRVLKRFGSGEARILIGTQMVAKGHDFPGVTLVGVVAADASLNFPDFRAAERTFQLLTQVAGRAGRGAKQGIVIVQAYETEHYALQAALHHDFDGFVAQELQFRRDLWYPPFAHLALVRVEGALEEQTRETAMAVGAALKTRAKNVEGTWVLGPAPAPLTRLRGMWRFQILLKGRSRHELREVIAAMPRRPTGQVRQILDIDPFNML